MTCAAIIDHVRRLSASVSASTTTEVVVATSTAVRCACAELDELLSALECGDRLRSDLQALSRRQLTSLVIRCWTYLAWMHAIKTDARPMHGPSKDRLMWGLMRRYETVRTADTDMSVYIRQDEDQTRAGHHRHPALERAALVDLLQLNNITADALVSLPWQHPRLDSLRYLVERV